MREDSFDSETGSFDSELGNETEAKSQKDDSKLMNEDLIKSISQTLTMVLDQNKKLPNFKEIIIKQSNLCFSAKTIPNISIYDYLVRIQQYSFIEKNTLILSLIYIDRLCQSGQITLTYYNIHRILFAAVLIAIKYNEDSFYDNKYYSEIAGVKLKELKSIEYTFLELCDFKMFVNDKIFDKYCSYLNSFGKNELIKEND